MTRNDLREILLEAVEKGLSSLGDSPKQAMMFHLESSFGLSKKKIPTNLKEFADALEKIFGPGASHVEKLIVEHLYGKLGLEFKEEEKWSFVIYVDNARKHMAAEKDV